MKSLNASVMAVVLGLFTLQCPGQLIPMPTITPPVDTTVGYGSNATFKVRITPAVPGLTYRWYFNGVKITGATASSYTVQKATFSRAGEYSVQVGWLGMAAFTLPPARLTVLDLTRPKVTITAPLVGSILKVPLAAVAGTATDNVGVSRVVWQVSSGASGEATLTPSVLGVTRWAAAVGPLWPGTNIIAAFSVDVAGNVSLLATRKVVYVVYAPLTVQIEGNGTVSPNMNNRSLAVGRNYSMVATARTGYVLDGWYRNDVGGRWLESRTATFTMTEGLVLTAKFVPNPFIPKQGSYRGLVGWQGLFNDDPVRHESSGGISLVLASSGAYSATLRMAGKSYPFTGQFNVNGNSHKELRPRGESPMNIDLHLDSMQTIDGTIWRSDWTKSEELFAARVPWHSRTNPCPFAGRYTWINTAFTDPSFARWPWQGSSSYPLDFCGSGDGFGTLIVDANGLVTLAGTLADNQPVLTAGRVDPNGYIPFYAPLYGGKGSLLAPARPGHTDRLSWIKPTLPTTTRYPDGFTNKSDIISSRYVAPKVGVRVLAVTNAAAIFSGPPTSLEMPFVNELALGSNNRVTNLCTNKMVMTITTASGLFSGSVVDPTGGKTLLFKGALLQNRNTGSGLCLLPASYNHPVQTGYVGVRESASKGMALIPAGAFIMGDTFSEGNAGELPLHSVLVSAFYMDKYEVTKALWDEVYVWAITHGYAFDRDGSGKAANHPVHSLNWYDMVKWCNARSEKAGLIPAYYTDAAQTTVYRTGQVTVRNDWVKWNAGYRLPTEAEWEKAARGGASGHRFPWSNVETITHGQANYQSSTDYAYDTSPTGGFHPTFNDGVYPYTSPVGYFAPNGYGLSDMAGNVWERCWDWYDYDASWYANGGASQTDTRGPVGPLHFRLLRGGAWYNYSYVLRCAQRSDNAPDVASYGVGFRCVRGL